MIVIVTTLLGIAAAVALTRFGEGSVTANRDALTKDCQTIISRAKVFYRKSLNQDGGGNSFTGLTFTQLAMGSGSLHTNGHGRFTLTSTAQTVTCLGTGNEQVVDGNDVQVKIVYFANFDSTGYQDNMTGGTLHAILPMKAIASSAILADLGK